ncbi:MAG: Ig-like domain-containing protein [Micromonosporaceae bacterium]
MFGDQANLKAASRTHGWGAKGEAVATALRRTADRSQANTRHSLKAAKADFQTFYIANAILVRGGDQALAKTLAKDPAVSSILPRRTYQLHKPTLTLPQAPGVNAVEWGVNAIRADQVWSTFGTRGEGIVVDSIDTGVDFDHPALVSHYRGSLGDSTFDHNYNWYDPSNICGNPSLAPCDNNNHGTHTIGTMVGDDGDGNQIGVAPGAKFISAKGCESTNCSDAALIRSGQWMLAPTDLSGANPRSDLRPNIINNSWGTGNDSTVDPFYRATIQAWRAAGIFPAFSNGNSGPGCNTTGSPADNTEAFGTGAFNINGDIASFSSRGPGENGIIRPNLAAPGTNIRSSISGGGYAAFNGTSMASPHTAGTVALVWSAAPFLIGDLAQTGQLLDNTAVDVSDLTCGGTADDNNVWGEGKLDAFAAVTAAVGTNQPPVAADDAYAAIEDTTLNVAAPGVLGNDTDADGDPLTAILVSNPSHGTLTLNADGSLAYVPAANYNGPDSFTYRASDGSANSNVATVSLTVSAVNDAPIVNADSYVVTEDTPLVVPAPGVLGNDTDVDGDPLSASLGSAPLHGSVLLNGDGSFSYTPAANYNGPDSFTYTASDGTATSPEATVLLDVTPVNDQPVAVNDSYSTVEDTVLTVSAPGVLGNDTDPEGDALSAVPVSGPSHGGLTLNADGSFTYTPDVNYSGPDSFTYRATDGTDVSNLATVSITVTPADDPPTVAVAAGGSCGDDGHSGTVNLQLTDSDTPPSSLTLSVTTDNVALLPVGNVSFGGSGATRTLTATTVDGVTGTAVLTVIVNDGTSSGTVTITVKVDGNGVGTVNGTDGADMLFGQNGNDALNGLAGNDLLCSGNGNDRISGGDGADTMFGALGNDQLTGGAGPDHFNGGAGTDTATDYTPAQGDTRVSIP